MSNSLMSIRPMRRSLVRCLVIALTAVVLFPATPVAAQSPTTSPEHAAAYAVVTGLFDGMRARDTAAMRTTFESNAVLQSLTPTGVKSDGIEGWLRSVGAAPTGTLIDERLANPVVHVDADLASVWVDYWLFVGDRFSHCGVDAILLAKREGSWRIFSVVDTRRREGCAPAPAR